MARGKVSGAAAPSLSPSLSREESEYRAQDDLRTLSRAEEIRSDHRRMRHVKRHLGRQQKLVGRLLTRKLGRG